MGVPDDRFPELAAMAVKDPTAGGNPRPFDQADAERMLRDAWAGRLV
jgi:alcohol dehydrogenase class IV